MCIKQTMRFRHAEKAVNRDRDKGSSSAAIAIQALRVLLHTVFKVGTELRTDFGGKNSRITRFVILRSQLSRCRI